MTKQLCRLAFKGEEQSEKSHPTTTKALHVSGFRYLLDSSSAFLIVSSSARAKKP